MFRDFQVQPQSQKDYFDFVERLLANNFRSCRKQVVRGESAYGNGGSSEYNSEFTRGELLLHD